MREGTRQWMREKIRRRTKRGPNNSEATGNTGQEIPTDQPAALRPNYPEAHRDAAQHPVDTAAISVPSVAASSKDTEVQQQIAPAAIDAYPQLGSIVLETQPESLSTPPAEAQPVPAAHGTQPAPKGYVVLAIGLPGSGKTTWYKRRGVTPLSSDLLRNILFDDITDQRYSGLVFSTLRSLLRARLIAKMPWNYVDATNLSAHERRQWIKMARSFGYEAQAVFFDVPLSVCMQRNSRRDRRVADDVMEKLFERLRPPSFREGFTKITVVRVKGQPGQTASGGEPTAETFNAPVAGDFDSEQSSGLDEPAGEFVDAAAGSTEALRALSSPEGHSATAGDQSLDGPTGRLRTLGSNHTDAEDQPDNYE